MRRRPEEDDQEEQQRRQRQRAGRGRPADDRRNRPGRAADDDVLRRRALQPAGVDEDVERAADERHHRGEQVDPAREHDERERQQREPELERPRGSDATRGDRPRLRPLAHELVDVRVEHVVQRGGAAAGEREPAERRDGQPERRPALGAEHQSSGSGDEEQRHDPRLRQRDVVAPRRPRNLDAAAEHENGGHDGSRERQRAQSDVHRIRPGRLVRERDDPADGDLDHVEPERGLRGADEERVLGMPVAHREPHRHDEREPDEDRDLVRAGPLAGDDRDPGRERGRDGGQAEPGAGTRRHRWASSRRRRSRSGRSLVIGGSESKLCSGGGEVVYHSSVFARHGSLPTRGPDRQLLITL